MSYQAVLLTLQTVIQMIALIGGGYVLVSRQHQRQQQSQHLHLHPGSFQEVEVDEDVR